MALGTAVTGTDLMAGSGLVQRRTRSAWPTWPVTPGTRTASGHACMPARCPAGHSPSWSPADPAMCESRVVELRRIITSRLSM